MKYNPHDYQRYAAEFIITHPISALLLDMGLGKTSITLTAINDLLFDSFEIHKVLVIAPLRVARDTWGTEIEKWEHLKNLRYSVVVGTAQERISALSTPADIYIINRENIMNAYEIKTGMSRAKISHLMDAETWMNANKAVELGFADGILAREEPMEEQPANALMYSEAQVVNSLMGRIAEKCRIVPKTEHKTKAEDLFSRLDLIKNWR